MSRPIVCGVDDSKEAAASELTGAHERGKLRAAMQGSVAGKLAASAPIRVLVVPSPVAAPSARDDESLHADSQPNAEELLCAGQRG